uniref:Galectin n=1 Tax=Meloidogyne floridensis TaxID=298350 RepID=A0A915NS73_9BILA
MYNDFLNLDNDLDEFETDFEFIVRISGTWAKLREYKWLVSVDPKERFKCFINKDDKKYEGEFLKEFPNKDMLFNFKINESKEDFEDNIWYLECSLSKSLLIEHLLPSLETQSIWRPLIDGEIKTKNEITVSFLNNPETDINLIEEKLKKNQQKFQHLSGKEYEIRSIQYSIKCEKLIENILIQKQQPATQQKEIKMFTQNELINVLSTIFNSKQSNDTPNNQLNITSFPSSQLESSSDVQLKYTNQGFTDFKDYDNIKLDQAFKNKMRPATLNDNENSILIPISNIIIQSKNVLSAKDNKENLDYGYKLTPNNLEKSESLLGNGKNEHYNVFKFEPNKYWLTNRIRIEVKPLMRKIPENPLKLIKLSEIGEESSVSGSERNSSELPALWGEFEYDYGENLCTRLSFNYDESFKNPRFVITDNLALEGLFPIVNLKFYIEIPNNYKFVKLSCQKTKQYKMWFKADLNDDEKILGEKDGDKKTLVKYKGHVCPEDNYEFLFIKTTEKFIMFESINVLCNEILNKENHVYKVVGSLNDEKELIFNCFDVEESTSN